MEPKNSPYMQWPFNIHWFSFKAPYNHTSLFGTLQVLEDSRKRHLEPCKKSVSHFLESGRIWRFLTKLLPTNFIHRTRYCSKYPKFTHLTIWCFFWKTIPLQITISLLFFKLLKVNWFWVSRAFRMFLFCWFWNEIFSSYEFAMVWFLIDSSFKNESASWYNYTSDFNNLLNSPYSFCHWSLDLSP